MNKSRSANLLRHDNGDGSGFHQPSRNQDDQAHMQNKISTFLEKTKKNMTKVGEQLSIFQDYLSTVSNN